MTELRFTNTLTRSKERFEPLNPDRVGLYVCGPTVYDRAHIGNARPAIVFDVLFRLLRHVYGDDHVRYVRNLTDVDDKIIVRARESGRPIEDITSETTRWYHEDMAAVGVLPPTVEPKATEHIAEMIAMIATLVEREAAYAAEGHVLFAVGSQAAYGALSNRTVEDMIAGARVEVAPYKRDPMDFVLWKPSTGDEPGWESPWGRGRPGWHIECSAMSEKHLGESFDIHGGGVDLVFPHHENERAQSLAANPKSQFARVWMHNGFLQVEGQKMSKSLGNFFTVRDLLDQGIPGEVIRYAMLTTQYRQPFDWTQRLVEEARNCLTRWRRIADGAEAGPPPESVLAALADDLNTPKAIAEMHALAGAGDGAALKSAGQLLGLLTDDLGGWDAAPTADAETAKRIDAALAARAAARKARDFARADALRDGLAAAGVDVRDTAGGAEWSLSSTFDAALLPELDQ